MGCIGSKFNDGASDSTPLLRRDKPTDPDAHVLRAQALNAQGKTEQALAQLDDVIKQHPDCLRAYMERGNLRYNNKEWALAAADLTAALKIEAKMVPALHKRAQATLQLKMYDEALTDVNLACSLDPDNAQLRALRQTVLRARLGTHGQLAVCTSGESEEDVFAAADTPKANKLCTVCMDKERGCRLRPCMHGALCVGCGQDLKARGYGCPICGSKIDTVEVGHFLTTFAADEAQALAVIAACVGPTGSITHASPGPSRLSRMGVPAAPLSLAHLTTSAPSMTHLITAQSLPALQEEEPDINSLAAALASPGNTGASPRRSAYSTPPQRLSPAAAMSHQGASPQGGPESALTLPGQVEEGATEGEDLETSTSNRSTRRSSHAQAVVGAVGRGGVIGMVSAEWPAPHQGLTSRRDHPEIMHAGPPSLLTAAC